MVHVSYCWMEKSPTGVLFVPRSDGRKYEYPADLLFDTIEQANAWRQEQADDEDDFEEMEYIRSWVLCERTLREVDG